jgi:hypothetical protein
MVIEGGKRKRETRSERRRNGVSEERARKQTRGKNHVGRTEGGIDEGTGKGMDGCTEGEREQLGEGAKERLER